MKNETLKSNAISEAMLAPHLRNKIGGGSSVYQTTVITEIIAKTTGICGTTINKGQLVYLESDGRLMLADNGVHKAEYVALMSGSTGTEIEIATTANIGLNITADFDENLLLGHVGDATKTAPTAGIIQIVATKKTSFIAFNIQPALYL